MNDSDDREEAEDRSLFLKGGTLTALWSSIVNHADADFMCKQQNGWWNAVIVKGNRKSFALTNVCRIVDSESSSTN